MKALDQIKAEYKKYNQDTLSHNIVRSNLIKQAARRLNTNILSVVLAELEK